MCLLQLLGVTWHSTVTSKEESTLWQPDSGICVALLINLILVGEVPLPCGLRAMQLVRILL